MRKTRKRPRAALCAAIAAAVITAAVIAAPAALGGRQDVAIVKIGNLVLRANGGITPQALPRRRYAPIRFQGYGTIRSRDGSLPPEATKAAVNFDRDGRLNVNGLPSCPPARVEALPPPLARRACKGAIVGSGKVEATLQVPILGPVQVTSPLTIFNGPRQGRNPTAILHAWTTLPVPEVYAPIVTLERRPQGVQARVDLPDLAGDGVITGIRVKVGRRWRFRGKRPSYASARCSRGILTTGGRFEFDDGKVISGTLYTPCQVRRARRGRR